MNLASFSGPKRPMSAKSVLCFSDDSTVWNYRLIIIYSVNMITSPGTRTERDTDQNTALSLSLLIQSLLCLKSA